MLDAPRFLSDSRVTAVDRGTATHTVLEQIDFGNGHDAAAVRAEVDRLQTAGRLTREQAAVVDVDAIVWLMSTDIGRQLRAGNVRREVPVYFAHGDAADCQDRVMVRGRIDALVPDAAGGWRIVDYKTDQVRGDALEARTAEYAGQLRLYRSALDRITGGRVRGASLVFLDAREIRHV